MAGVVEEGGCRVDRKPDGNVLRGLQRVRLGPQHLVHLVRVELEDLHASEDERAHEELVGRHVEA